MSFARAKTGETALHCAAMVGSTEIVRLLLAHGGDPRIRDSEGQTPLDAAIALSGEVLGAMFFGHPDPAKFSDRHERSVGGVVAQAAVAIDNARLYERERAARADAERISRVKDEFLATLSHELRTPLNAILGWSHVLRSDSTLHDPAEVRQGLEVIERNSRAQTKIIEDLLEISRIVSGKIRLDVQRIDLAPVIDAAVDTVRHAAESKGIRLQVVLDPYAGPVSGDPARLQQVFWNLLSNSVKHSNRGGRIQVLLERVPLLVDVTIHCFLEAVGRASRPCGDVIKLLLLSKRGISPIFEKRT